MCILKGTRAAFDSHSCLYLIRARSSHSRLSKLQYASRRLIAALVLVTRNEDAPAHRAGRRIFMELRFENGFNGDSGLFDRLNSFRQDIEEAACGHMHARADVIEDKDAYHFYLDIPGLKAESLDVQVDDDQLTVAAERKSPEWPQEAEIHIAERGHGPIRRAFKLPLNASRDGIRASYTDGVLELTVEKRPESKRVKVQVN